jgi:peptidoglycan/LPS O-acetylase OafA/YrhL
MHPWLLAIKELGWIGVPIFFILSGYLITALALEEGNRFSVSRFYARRALRLWPLFFTVVALGLLAWQSPRLRWARQNS